MAFVLSSDCRSVAAAAIPATAQPQRSDPEIEGLLQPYLEQACRIRSIVELEHDAQGNFATNLLASPEDAWLSKPVADTAGDRAGMALRLLRLSWGQCNRADTLGDLALQVNKLLGERPGIDLLVAPEAVLREMSASSTGDIGFCAIVALVSHPPPAHDDDSWRLRRDLFDRGLICIGSLAPGDHKALCFLTSEAVLHRPRREAGLRGHVTMSELANGCRFGNQLFRYAYVWLYASRHGLVPAFPDWEGRGLFGLDDESCVGLSFPQRTFQGFTDDDRRLWDLDVPPMDVDLNGYFQEIPACWQRHRNLLRRLFELPNELQSVIDNWRHDVTRGGERTLVAIHVRRGDYRKLQLPETPWLRVVPEHWYLAWLRAIWRTLPDPVLFVATDEPDAILPVFREFEMLSNTFGTAAGLLPDHVRDFEIMRRADTLAICNSSFSRMAAILAADAQKCFLPCFEARGFVPYEPWIDPAFWARFAESQSFIPVVSQHPPRSPASAANTSRVTMADREDARDASTKSTVYFDVSDLILYLMSHVAPSGIQRVQCEILARFAASADAPSIHLVALREVGDLGEIDKTAFLQIIEAIRQGARSRSEIKSELQALAKRSVPRRLRPRDVLVILGAFWGVRGMGLLLQSLKNSGVILGVFIHDILPLTTPEYFGARDARLFAKSVIEALTFADFLLTTSEYNKSALTDYLRSRRCDPLPVHIVPLARERVALKSGPSNISARVTHIIGTSYVLCVGTIEVRKNPSYLFNIWKLMVRSGRKNVPTLLFAGRKGWLVQDFLDQLKACDFLDGKIVLLHDVTDAELDLLYRNCLLTVFPSFAEGWGLPVSESLAHGKISVCAAVGGIPEVGGALLDYIDPYNVSDGLAVITRYIDDPAARCDREREIEHLFKPRSWRDVADDLLTSTCTLARQVRHSGGVAAVRLPPGRFLPITADAAASETDGQDGALSAELACISGWEKPQSWGARGGEPSTLRFRPDAPVGSRISLILRLAAYSSGSCRIRLASGSGAETTVLVEHGPDRVAVLSCDVEPGQLITVRLSGSLADGKEGSKDGPYWILKGLLYFVPGRVAAAMPLHAEAGPGAQGAPSKPVPPSPQPVDPKSLRPSAQRVRLPEASWSDLKQAPSFGAFLQGLNCSWSFDFDDQRDAPIFADRSDRQAFYSGCGKASDIFQVGKITDSIKLIRRSDQFVSMSRFTEGSIFDHGGMWRGAGYLKTCPPGFAPWLAIDEHGLWLDQAAVETARCYDKSCLIFYNGNLHNYYHWMTEGLLSLDILSHTMGPAANINIILPKSMDINALIDHRGSLGAVGLDRYPIVEVPDGLIKVREAIWADSDLIQSMPAPYVRDFQRRVAARYAGVRGPRNRRLFVDRKGRTRTIHNLEQVKALLARYDFETVYLEGMKVADQILLFQSAEFVIGVHGAGLSNLLFCEPGTRVIELIPNAELRPFFWLISEKLGLVHGMQFCALAGEKGFQSSVVVDVEKLQALFCMVEAHR